MRLVRLVRMAAVELFDETTSGDICDRLPGVFRVGVAFPLYEVFNATTVALGIKDILDFKEFLIVFDIEGRRNWGLAVRQ
jgi:hypothetical protein